jgi:transcriptional regulator with XRE-family HTH domain
VLLTLWGPGGNVETIGSRLRQLIEKRPAKGRQRGVKRFQEEMQERAEKMREEGRTLVGYTYPSIQSYLKGAVIPSEEFIREAASILGVREDYLLTGEPPVRDPMIGTPVTLPQLTGSGAGTLPSLTVSASGTVGDAGPEEPGHHVLRPAPAELRLTGGTPEVRITPPRTLALSEEADRAVRHLPPAARAAFDHFAQTGWEAVPERDAEAETAFLTHVEDVLWFALLPVGSWGFADADHHRRTAEYLTAIFTALATLVPEPLAGSDLKDYEEQSSLGRARRAYELGEDGRGGKSSQVTDTPHPPFHHG